MKRLLLAWALLMVSLPTLALEPLTLDSLPQLQARLAGTRHALVFWSLSCAPCHQELTELSRLPAARRQAISLINTDDRSQQAQVSAFLAGLQLQQMDNWIFADAIPERLRAAIDADWYGELPRSYAIDADGKRHAQSGKADMAALADWLAAGSKNVSR